MVTVMVGCCIVSTDEATYPKEGKSFSSSTFGAFWRLRGDLCSFCDYKQKVYIIFTLSFSSFKKMLHNLKNVKMLKSLSTYI